MTEPKETWSLDGVTVTVTHPNKLYWPDDGLTKGQLLTYYRSMAPIMLPYFHDRPVTLRVFPEGISGFSYYRRDLPSDAPSWLRYVDYQTESDPHLIQLPLLDTGAGLVWMADHGSIEFHLWGSRAGELEEPDWAIFDLDPGDEADFAEVLDAALKVQEALQTRGLKGYPKTSGGRGVHIYIPLAPGHTYDAVRDWVKSLAADLSASFPHLIAMPKGATHEGKCVTVDYSQNSIGRNTAAPYTVRARPGAPVSAPLTWDEVREGSVHPSDFTMLTMPSRLAQIGDLFSPTISGAQRLVGPAETPS